jgi:hypothetical protein
MASPSLAVALVSLMLRIMVLLSLSCGKIIIDQVFTPTNTLPLGLMCTSMSELHNKPSLQMYLWKRAQNELSGNNTREDNPHLRKRAEGFFTSFQGFAVGNVSGVPMAYLRIYKSGNNNLHENLKNNSATNGKGSALWAGRKSPLDVPILPRITSSLLNSQVKPLSSLKVFTVVRDPMSHFLSGMTELFERPVPTEGKRTLNDPKAFLYSYLHESSLERAMNCTKRGTGKSGSCRRDGLITHIFPQMAFLNTGNLGPGVRLLVGQLENIEEDIPEIMRRVGVNDFHYDPSLGQHKESSADTMHIKERIRKLFADEPRYQRAICWLLLPDYVCLPQYPIPDHCKSILDEVATW